MAKWTEEFANGWRNAPHPYDPQPGWFVWGGVALILLALLSLLLS